MQNRLVLAFGLGAVTGLGCTLGSLQLRKGWRGLQEQDSEELAANAASQEPNHADVLLFKYASRVLDC